MKGIIFISIFLAFSITAKDFIVQKPIIFLTTPQRSKFEEPVLLQNLIKINNTKKKLLDNLENTERKGMVSYALSFNRRKGIGRSRKFRNDCSGFTRKVFYKFDIELFRLPRKELRRMNGSWINGVELIWKYCKRHGSVFMRKTPKPGDFVFFDNTHDRNKNKKYDDYFTHIGIVVKVDKDNTVHYIHKANSGIKVSKLNTEYDNKYKKGKKVINSYLRRKGKYRLSGQLVRGYGSIFRGENKDNDKRVVKKKDARKKEKKIEKKENKKMVAKKKNDDKGKIEDKKKNDNKGKGRRSSATSVPGVALLHRPQPRPYRDVRLISDSYRDKIVKKAVYYIGKRLSKEEFAIKVYSDLGFGIIDKEFNDEKYIEKAIFWSFKKNGRLFSALEPKIGDLIFFDKLNGKKHFLNIAIIEEINNSQIKFIYSSDGVIKRAYLNNKLWKTHKKEGKIVNSIFIKEKNSRRRLSSQFFRRFGSLFQK